MGIGWQVLVSFPFYIYQPLLVQKKDTLSLTYVNHDPGYFTAFVGKIGIWTYSGRSSQYPSITVSTFSLIVDLTWLDVWTD